LRILLAALFMGSPCAVSPLHILAGLGAHFAFLFAATRARFSFPWPSCDKLL
jgi:hypothetical protein